VDSLPINRISARRKANPAIKEFLWEETASSTLGVVKTCIELPVRIHPVVARELARWTDRAMGIPDLELRRQALSGLEKKRFHCVGGAVLSLTCRAKMELLIRAIVAIQTVSDYLDNLCDRVDRQPDAGSFALLHEAMMCCVDPGRPTRDYYGLCGYVQDDDGYLDSLVNASRSVLNELPGYGVAQPFVSKLVSLYSELHVTKHQDLDKRDALMVEWFHKRCREDWWRDRCAGLKWWEFGAAAGSTLGMFGLISASGHDSLTSDEASDLDRLYFPSISGLHILLDYFIDLEEDRAGGDLNFISYYASLDEAEDALVNFVKDALEDAQALPEKHRDTHLAVVKGLLAMYLSDPKVKRQGFAGRAENIANAAGCDAVFLTKSCGFVRQALHF
jgi:tetraprenyl-beta-curcumene synthase